MRSATSREHLPTPAPPHPPAPCSQEHAERDLARMRRMLEETRSDWQKKLRERRREVRGAGEDEGPLLR